MKIIILGGGASGLMLANILVKNHINADIEIIEKYEHVGKKLLITGNGRCNLTNTNITTKSYNNDFGYKIAKSFDTIQFFNELGLLTYIDNEGRVYPYSLVSNNVLDILRENLNNIKISTSTNIIRIRKKEQQYELTSDSNQTFKADILVLATGGKTYYKDSNSYILANFLEHKVVPLRPALNYLKVQENLSSIENIRCKAKAYLITNNQIIYEDYGEVLLKKEALSGIVIFQLSSIIAKNAYNNYLIELDLLPNMSEDEIVKHLKKFPNMIGMFPKMINQYICKVANTQDPLIISKTIKHLPFHVVENIDYKTAQVTSGGVDVNELKDTLESKIHDNLYFAGEIIDVDGLCGGYNLQFAFASANKVAQDILLKVGTLNEKK